MQIRQILIWAKNVFALGRQDYQWQHELCLYGWKDGASHYFHDCRTDGTVFEQSDIPALMKKADKGELKNIILDLMQGDVSGTVFREPKPSKSADHPTMKPVRLFARQIQNSTKPGEAVYDPFGGSGTTAVAAEQLGRNSFIMELDEHYASVIKERLERLTGETAVLVG